MSDYVTDFHFRYQFLRNSWLQGDIQQTEVWCLDAGGLHNWTVKSQDTCFNRSECLPHYPRYSIPIIQWALVNFSILVCVCTLYYDHYHHTTFSVCESVWPSSQAAGIGKQMDSTLALLSLHMTSLQFSSRYISSQESPYVLHPVSQKFPQCCFWNSSSVGLIDHGLVSHVLSR